MDISPVLGSSVCRDLGQGLFLWCVVWLLWTFGRVFLPTTNVGSKQWQEAESEIQ